MTRPLGRITIVLFACALALLALAAPLRAQPSGDSPPSSLPPRPLPDGTKLFALVDPEDVVLGDRFRYRIVLEGGVQPDRTTFPPFSSLGGIELESGPASRSYMSIVNGRSTTQYSYEFVLRAIDTGSYTIPPARLRINGEWYETNPVTFTIEDIPTGTGGLQGVISARTNDHNINRQLENRYFARVEVPDEAYHGQAVPVKVFVYRDPSLPDFIQYRVMQNASGNDFFVPDVISQQAAARGWNWQTVQIDGKVFERAELLTSVVIPTRTGNLRFTPPLIRVSLPTQPRYGGRNFDQLFDSMMPRTMNSIEAELPIRMAELEVLPTPPKPAEAVAQIVGDAAIELTSDRESLPHRELVTIALKIRGEGFFELLSRPEFPDLPHLSLVDVQSSASSPVVARGLLLSERRFDYTFQATSPGKTEIPSLVFSQFNPRTGEQTLLRTDALELSIVPDASGSIQVGGVAAGETIEGTASPTRARARELGRTIDYIETAPLTASAVAARGVFYTSPWFWAAQAVPAMLSLGWGFVAWRARRGTAETESARRRRARKAAAHALREAHRHLKSGDREEFYATLAHGILGYVATLLGRSAKGLTAEEAVDGLRARGCSDEACRRLATVLRDCDAIRYSPAPDTPESRNEAMNEAENLLVDLDAGEVNA